MKKTLLVFSALALTACSGNTVKDTLGLNRSAPDEFRVVSRPPLSIPPQFTLRAPANTDVSPNELSASQKAQSLVTSSTSPSKSTKKDAPATSSNAESQFLKNAGVNNANPMVRDELVEERFTKQEKEEESGSSWWNVFSSSDDKKDPLVDAKKEAERLKKNESEGQPVTKGETPETKARDTGALGKLLGY
jgi:hypothetical protein